MKAYPWFRCECGGQVDARYAKAEWRNEGEPLRWVGVPCSACEKTYTVEYTTEVEDAGRGAAEEGA